MKLPSKKGSANSASNGVASLSWSEGDIEAENSEESSRSEGSTTDEKEELRDILQDHESVSQREVLAEQSSAPPSCEVSPSDSAYSGRSSAPGTPMLRSARMSALRDRTPEPTASMDALLAGLAGRIHRHSSGPGGPDVTTDYPLRRSGRKSNVSRDNSPTDSVT
ncbi:LOW QUALITY PROTEIN: hypothetical protein DAPPUDRAFT_256595 [Daphnia pulex]|uniref:Uncharacterized protein n=1 Tax=Daphnia pulex TaxID=6669 RepID=E9HBQ6_DAPPU|nr:LOW QUALITY PROTEIN: hypothetical protein DAPPUDRAFT_256595 [Daphnia pulex]|eukprot:EFX70761.1 LOW QUALITY PROTEIN: hypothetical protein DAPPUDRAFT_256595 [Daphnia pulex]